MASCYSLFEIQMVTDRIFVAHLKKTDAAMLLLPDVRRCLRWRRLDFLVATIIAITKKIVILESLECLSYFAEIAVQVQTSSSSCGSRQTKRLGSNCTFRVGFFFRSTASFSVIFFFNGTY